MTGHRGLVQAVHSVIQAVHSVIQAVHSVIQTVHSVIQTVHTRYADGTYPSCGRYISAMQMVHIRHADGLCASVLLAVALEGGLVNVSGMGGEHPTEAIRITGP